MISKKTNELLMEQSRSVVETRVERAVRGGEGKGRGGKGGGGGTHLGLASWNTEKGATFSSRLSVYSGGTSKVKRAGSFEKESNLLGEAVDDRALDSFPCLFDVMVEVVD